MKRKHIDFTKVKISSKRSLHIDENYKYLYGYAFYKQNNLIAKMDFMLRTLQKAKVKRNYIDNNNYVEFA